VLIIVGFVIVGFCFSKWASNKMPLQGRISETEIGVGLKEPRSDVAACGIVNYTGKTYGTADLKR
jgi:hypothetical protein